MLEWGLFGLGEATAGLFLAHHYSNLGPYFGDLKGNEWPHFPLKKSPSLLEENFDSMLMNLTYIMSNKKLQNVSLLDLPAFGSKIENLKKDQMKQPNWPTEINFALLRSGANLSQVFVQYKTLLEHWANHMDKLFKEDQPTSFSHDMETNIFFNFTSYIIEDMKTFLCIIAGTLLYTYRTQANNRRGLYSKIITLLMDLGLNLREA